MTKQEKIAALSGAMEQRKRDEGEEFYCFSNTAPRELTDLFLEHYEVRDVDYEIFSRACDIVSEAYAEYADIGDGKNEEDYIEQQIYECANDSANVYTAVRLGYLNIWNEDEISELMNETGETSISIACAIWYDRQVEQAAVIINEWINA